MRFSVLAIVATLLSVALAQQAYPTAPVATTKWNAGAAVTIKWNLNPPAATAGLKIDLLTGDNPQSQRVVATLGTGAPGATKFAATLPANLKSGYYSVRIGDSYSSYFLIQGEGPVPTGPLPTAATTTLISSIPVTSSATVAPTSTVAPLPVITTTTPAGAKPTGSGAGFLKAGVVAPVAAAAVAVIMAAAF
ncbi:hypothetical protein K457DRAFT_140469 [Linnemannia elongata AG-77]|uniref:Yeast cell wall synthesis Kre9/Knh1-like N-terminal domain-containing protein n=1 Tax=Linnemannia elongata AG-77 TaxID=1314771 RepID=A0A197JM23_9FUNG|nr:hypothetical protein K457DRAFT_140469 [Linnemannia elongata AG-77]